MILSFQPPWENIAREISPELEGAEVRVVLTCKQQVQHSAESFITNGGGLAGQRQDLCGAGGAQRSELCAVQQIGSGWQRVFVLYVLQICVAGQSDWICSICMCLLSNH